MYYVYLLQSQIDKSYYTGFTTNLNQRLIEHNAGKVAYTCSKLPFYLIWYCAFVDKIKATQFEKYLKSGSGFAFARKHLV